ncbi:hypothetical protein BJX96DRAFT_177150 [Aspergillus floccosus]
MFRLLDLPRELRDLILEYAVYISQTPPSDPWSGPGDRAAAHDVDYEAQVDAPRDVLYQPTLTGETTLRKLLLVNRQIREETMAIIRKITRPSYCVDVIALHQLKLWPTWVSVPVIRTHLDEVRMELRIFGHCLSRQAALANRTDTGSFILKWRFYAMLERFLIHGPLFLPNQAKGEEKDRKCFMRTLTINVTACPDEKHPLASSEITYSNYWRWLCTRMMHRPLSVPFDLDDVMPRPEWMASGLSTEIGALLMMDYHHLYYGGLLYEHIGAIRILVDGKVHKEFNLAERLAALRFNCEQSVFTREKRRRYFWRWKRTALRKRLDAGLPVIMPEDPELADLPESEDEG